MTAEEKLKGIAKYRKGWYKTDNLRFCIERLPGSEIVIRLPFKIGVSFWEPWWAIMVGISLNSIGIEWRIGCFAGEIWIDHK